MDFNQLLKFLSEAYPAFVPAFLIIVLYFLIGSFRNEAVEKKINTITFQELINKIAIQFSASSPKAKATDATISELKLVDFMTNQRNAWKIKIYQQQSKHIDRIDFIVQRQMSIIVILLACGVSYLLYKFDTPKEICNFLSVVVFFICAIFYLAVREWLFKIKDCYNSNTE